MITSKFPIILFLELKVFPFCKEGGYGPISEFLLFKFVKFACDWFDVRIFGRSSVLFVFGVIY